MKIKNDSKKSRWDLASDGFRSKKSIRELLSLLLLRHGMVCRMYRTLLNLNVNMNDMSRSDHVFRFQN